MRLCARGDQQIPGVSFRETDLYSPVLKATEARLSLALAAAEGAKVIKTDTNYYKASLFVWEMGDAVVYIRPPDWWPEPIPMGHVFLLLKSIYGTRQAARKWHTHTSTWMENNGCEAINGEKTSFMKRKGAGYIIHGLFVDDMMHIYSCDAMKDEFPALYKKDFEITGGSKMEKFLGMVVEQDDKSIKIHLDNYVKGVIAEYLDYIKKSLRPKKVPISPGTAFRAEEIPEFPDPTNRSITVRLWRSFSLRQHGTNLTFHLRYHSWHVFVYQRVRHNGHLYAISWNILQDTPPSRSSIAGVRN